MQFYKAASAAVFIAVISTAASAATVTVVSGTVAINRGSGFKPVSGGTGAAAGDRIKAAANSSAQIVYENGCVVEVAADQVVTVAPAAPCVQGAGASAGLFGGGIVGPALIGAAVVGGAVAVISASNDDNDKPISP